MTASRQSPWWLPAAVAWGVLASAQAETINFYNPPGLVNLTSAGAAMDGTFHFELGVFSGGFVPTRNNLTEWAGKWNAAETADYSGVSHSFDGQIIVTSNISPFLAGTAAYIWGKRTGATGDEWILFRKSEWVWPAPNPMNPFPLDWNAAEADLVVIGSINGPGHLMKSESVMSYAQWRTAELAGEALDAAGDDPDADGTSNLLEFVFGTPPRVSGPPPQTSVSWAQAGAETYLQISIPRLRGRLAVLTAMVSTDLSLWQSGAAHTTEISNDVETWVVRDLVPYGPGQARRFMKLRAVLP